MNKTWLVIKREYLTRVRKRTFSLATILFPLLYLALIFVTGYMAAKSAKSLRVALIDSSGFFNKAMLAEANQKDSSSYLEYITGNTDSVIKNYKEMGYEGYIVLPPTQFENGMKDLSLVTDKTY